MSNYRGGNYDDNRSQHSGGGGGSQYGGSNHSGSQHGGRRDDNYGRGGDNYRGGQGDYQQDRYGGGGGGGGGRGGYQGGGHGGYQGGRRDDDMSRDFSRMNMGGGGRGGRGGNMYSSQSRGGPPRTDISRSAAGVANMGDLAGSAQYPRMPVPKKNLEHTIQEFAERPAGSVYEKKIGHKTELYTNHALVRLPEKPLYLYEYNIDVYQNKKKLEKREEASVVFREIISGHAGRKMLPKASDYIFNDVNLLWSLDQLPRAEGDVGDKRKYLVYKYTRRIEFGQNITQEQDSQLISTIVDAIATARVRNPQLCQNKFTVFKRSMFMLQDKDHTEEFDDAPLFVRLRNGLDARMGISIGIKLNLRAGITACYDLSHTMFTRPSYPIIRLMCELIHGDVIDDKEYEATYDSRLKNAHISEDNKQMMRNILNKMKLCYTVESALELDDNGEEKKQVHTPNPPKGKDFKFYDVTDPADRCTFFNENNKSMTVAEYYLQCKNVRLRYPNLPCIQKKPSPKNGNKFIVFPMEFVTLLADPKRYEGLSTVAMKADMVRWTTFNARQRRLVLNHIISQKRITDVPAVVDNNDRQMRRHQLSIDTEMLTVKATVLPPPTVVYGNSTFHDSDHLGEWQAVTNDPVRTVLDDAVYRRDRNPDAPKLKKRLLGSILKINSPYNNTKMEIDDKCYNNLMRAIEVSGQPVVWENEEHKIAAIQNEFEYNQNAQKPGEILDYFNLLVNNIDEKYKQNDDEIVIPIVFVIFAKRFTTLANNNNGIRNDYNMMKYLGDARAGVFTQGMLFETFQTIGSSPETCKYTRLIVEKVLGKVGTTHRKLAKDETHKSWPKVTNPKEPTLFLGVDVSHPSTRDLKDPNGGVKKMSVATVVGNIDIDATEYRASSKIQEAGEERIVRFTKEIGARLADFISYNGIRPAHIVVYRDGLSEGDFQRTLYEERIAIENACVGIAPAYQPTITYIVVSKRHHTRFFLKDESEGILEQGLNVRPGTLVEDVVTTNNYYDFFLTTQIGQIGLARPTHYYVLHNTWNVLPTFWPTITHALTYMFCRTTTTVALPAPVLYAHLAAKRAKETMDGAINAYGLDGKFFNMEVYADVADLTAQINNHQELDGMVFV